MAERPCLNALVAGLCDGSSSLITPGFGHLVQIVISLFLDNNEHRELQFSTFGHQFLSELSNVNTMMLLEGLPVEILLAIARYLGSAYLRARVERILLFRAWSVFPPNTTLEKFQG